VGGRALVLSPWDGFGSDPLVGGRLELQGQGPVLHDLFRVYGGGGLQFLRFVSGPWTHRNRWGGGGHLGLELFMRRSLSFTIEVGGNGGGFPDTGATVTAGLRLYPWN
jgi:hypothetical protein